MAEQMVLLARDAEGAKPLAGAVFEVRSTSLPAPLAATTDAEGRAVVTVDPGRYDIVNTAPPTNYAPASVLARTVEVQAGQPRPEEFHFARLAILRVEVVFRTEGSTPRPIAKATVLVRESTGAEPSQSAATGDDGWATFALPPGAYWVEHRLPPTGYLPDDSAGRPITLAPGATESTRFVDLLVASLVVRVRSDDDKAVVGASVMVRRNDEPQRQAKTGDDGTVRLELPAGKYAVTYQEPPAGYVLGPEASRTTEAMVGPGEAATAEFRSPRAATLTIKAQRAETPSVGVGGGRYKISLGDQAIKAVEVDATGCGVVDGLAAGTYTVAQLTAPTGYALSDQASSPQKVALAAGAAQSVTLSYVSAAAPIRKWGWGGSVSWVIVILLLGWAGLVGNRRHWDQLSASLVLAVGLSLLAMIGGRRSGFFRSLIGEDNRVSTSKTQLAIWTVAVVWAMAFLTFHAVFDRPTQLEHQSCAGGTPAAPNNNLSTTDRVQCALPESRWSDYLILLGGPFAAAVLAKGFVTWRVNNGTLQKTMAPEHKTELAEVVKNDEDSTDLVDSQYLLFNVAALAYFAAALVQRPELPEMPPALLAMTSGAAALYAANKAVASNKPAITGVSPATIRPGEEVTISGQFFVLATTPAQPVTVSLEGFGPLQVKGQPTATTIITVVASGVPVGQRNLTVTTSAGVTTAGWPVQVGADQPQILGVQESEAVPGADLHLFGRRFRSALDTSATNATVWFGTEMVLGQLTAPTASGLETLTVRVPPTLNGAQISVQVQSTQGVRSDPVTVALLGAPRVVNLEAKAVADNKVSVQARIRGFTDAMGQRTAANQVKVDNSSVEFSFIPQGDRVDLVTVEVPRPQASVLSVELRDHQGRSTGPLSAPIVVQ